MSLRMRWLIVVGIIHAAVGCSSEATSDDLSVDKLVRSSDDSMCGGTIRAKAGRKLRLRWDGSLENLRGDWYGLFAKDEIPTGPRTHAYPILDMIRGRVVIALPHSAHQNWEVRRISKHRIKHWVRCPKFIVEDDDSTPTPTPEPITDYGIANVPTVVIPGSPVTFQWTSIANHSPTDWIGLYPVGADASAFATYQYVPAGTSGTMTLTLPKAATGNWELRYFINDSFIQTYQSASFVAQPVAYTLAGTPTNADPGSAVTVQWTATDGHTANDWIGLYQVGADASAFNGFAYLTADASGSATLTLPTWARGQWEFRIFGEFSYDLKAASPAFTAQYGATDTTLTGTPTSAEAGSDVTVAWTAPADHGASDWIGLFQAGAANYEFEAFSYVPEGATGTVTLTLPADATGNWEFRYFTNGGYDAKTASAWFSIN